MQTERVTFLTSPANKATLASRAAARGISTGEYVRRRLEEEDGLPDDQMAELEALMAEANAAIPKIAASLDRLSARLEDIHRENDKFLRDMGVRS